MRVFIRGLRQKLEPDPTRPTHILTELGVGYRVRDWMEANRNLFAALKFEDAREIAKAAMMAFTAAEVDSVYLVYNQFKSVMHQAVVVERLLPIPRLEIEPVAGAAPLMDYLYEPGPEQLFEDLLPSHVEVQVFRALLESAAAEHAARMTAMNAATRNSAEMIDQLTLYMNKVRQAAITREIIEVVSGAEAL